LAANKKKRAEVNEQRKAKGLKPLTSNTDPLARIIHGTLNKCWNEMVRLNQEGAGVFITVNETDGKGRETKNIKRVRALFLDLDGAPLDPVMARKPHIVVESSPGRFHPYLLATGVKLDQFSALQKELIARFSGDTAVHDLPRVMRLPGFVHRKGAPFLSHVISVHDAPPYNFTTTSTAAPTAKNFFHDVYDLTKTPTQRLNDAALANLAAWVPELFPKARPYHDGGYRVSSADLGRDLEEDLSLVPEGIKDFGVHDMGDEREGKRTPIDIVMEWGQVDFGDACDWLRERLGLPNGGTQEETKAEKEAEDEKQIEDFIGGVKPHAFPNEASLKQYDWLLGRHLLRGEVAGSAAMGGTGKSSLAIVEALAMASGKQLTYDTVPIEPIRVVLINLEDKRNTMDKRIAAAMRHHGLTKEDIGDRLIVIAKGEVSFKIAKQTSPGNVVRNPKAIAMLTRLMIEKRADVLSIDSFIRTHNVNENDNPAIEQVIECFEEVAQEAKCCVHLWHHTRKGDGQAATVEAARGAKAFIDACRSVRMLETMSEAQAEKLDVEKPREYFRVYSGKRNFAPHVEDSNWFHIAGVILKNNPLFTAEGDNIGVVEKWSLPEAKVSPENIEAIRNAVADGQRRESSQAEMWVGKAIGPVLGLDPTDDKEKIKRAIRKVIKEGILKTASGFTGNRKPCIFVVPGDGLVEPK
jgi:AAA domain/RepB DNA-primase N-terminal domain